MKNRKYIGPIILLMVAIFLDWEKWQIADSTTILATGFVNCFVVYLLAEWFIWCGFLLVTNIKKSKRHIAFLLVLMFLVFGSFTYLPISKYGMKINAVLNQPCRENVVEMLNRGELAQTGLNKFSLPVFYRLTSHTGKILVESNEPYTNNYDRVLFYIHCGSDISSAVIYCADNAKLKSGDFGRIYKDIYEIKPGWYFATMKWQ